MKSILGGALILASLNEKFTSGTFPKRIYATTTIDYESILTWFRLNKIHIFHIYACK